MGNVTTTPPPDTTPPPATSGDIPGAPAATFDTAEPSGADIDDALFQQTIADTKALYAEMQALNLEFKQQTMADKQAQTFMSQA